MISYPTLPNYEYQPTNKKNQNTQPTSKYSIFTQISKDICLKKMRNSSNYRPISFLYFISIRQTWTKYRPKFPKRCNIRYALATQLDTHVSACASEKFTSWPLFPASYRRNIRSPVRRRSDGSDAVPNAGFLVTKRRCRIYENVEVLGKLTNWFIDFYIL